MRKRHGGLRLTALGNSKIKNTGSGFKGYHQWFQYSVKGKSIGGKKFHMLVTVEEVEP